VFRPDNKAAQGLALKHSGRRLPGFAAAEGFEITTEHVEIETGKGEDALDRRRGSRFRLIEP
jgi:hypothetical protein